VRTSSLQFSFGCVNCAGELSIYRSLN